MSRNSDFKVGDRVTVHGWSDQSVPDGTPGVVTNVPDHGYIRVRAEGEVLPLACTANELRHVE